MKESKKRKSEEERSWMPVRGERKKKTEKKEEK